MTQILAGLRGAHEPIHRPNARPSHLCNAPEEVGDAVVQQSTLCVDIDPLPTYPYSPHRGRYLIFALPPQLTAKGVEDAFNSSTLASSSS